MAPTKIENKVEKHFQKVKKRDGRIVPWDGTRILRAIWKAFNETKEDDPDKAAAKVAKKVYDELIKRYPKGYLLSIEEIQDVVEEALILMDYPKTAKAYILYRKKRAELRELVKKVPESVKKLVEESRKYFDYDPYREFIFYRTYSRWLDSEGRRETWIETVDRFMNFMKENLGKVLSDSEYEKIKQAILYQQVMPSMRLLWSAGPACRATNVAAYNCSFIAPTKIEDFGDIMYILMCGAGLGFSVESHVVQQLPIVKRQTGVKLKTYVIEDSKEGWARAIVHGMKAWYEGKDVDFDFSKLRPAGARLKTMGGRSSGPEPLRQCLIFIKNKILSRQGKRLSNLDVHDIICKIGEVVVVGGVRRTALISLSDLDDEAMRHAKEGQFYILEPQRSMANNSAVYNEKPTTQQFLEEWLALAKSGTGERGIFNRAAVLNQVPERRRKFLEKELQYVGTNPCGEIILRSKQFCNLTEVVARPSDTEETLIEKVRIATILGTYQATLTYFPFISKEWKDNCEQELLLGVSITGHWDCPIVRNEKFLQKLKRVAIETNEKYAKKFGINPSTCVTCVKPSGTVSQLVDAASGIHPRFSEYFIRRVRISATDPLFEMLKDQKIPYYPEVGQSVENATTFVLEFPRKSPKGAITRHQLSAIDQLEYWKKVKVNYTEHNPSCTIYVKPHEWIKVADWLYENWDVLGGLSFLPSSDHVYQLAPYEDITKGKYENLMKDFPELDFSRLVLYEKDDETQGAKEFACVAGVCEIDVPVEQENKRNN